MLMVDGPKKKKSTKKRFAKRRRLLIVSLVAVAILIAGGAAWWFFVRTAPEQAAIEGLPESDRELQSLRAAETSDEDIFTIIENYGPFYDEKVVKLQETNPPQWTPEELNEAYVVMYYASKIGAYSQADSVYWQIEWAGDSGIDLDSNRFGITAKDRAAIRTMIDKQMSPPSGSTEGDEE